MSTWQIVAIIAFKSMMVRDNSSSNGEVVDLEMENLVPPRGSPSIETGMCTWQIRRVGAFKSLMVRENSFSGGDNLESEKGYSGSQRG